MSGPNGYVGPRGHAVKLAIHPDFPGPHTTVAWWLLTGAWHPLWAQFVLQVVHLLPKEGLAPATLHFPGATHELIVIALDPGEPPRLHDAVTLVSGGLRAVGGFLAPPDVVHQFTATDEEMVTLADLCARACVLGALTPSTDGARAVLREQWLTSCVRTLAHMRGEEHAP